MAEHKKAYKSFIDKKKPFIKSNKHYEYKEEQEYTSEEKQTSNNALNAMISIALEQDSSSIRNKNIELEVKFGTKGIKRITKIDYDNVIKKLKSLDFIETGPEEYILRCMNEFIDTKTGIRKISNVRTELTGFDNIKNLCETNDINSSYNVKFVQKMPYMNKQKVLYKSIDFNHFNFRVSLNYEIEHFYETQTAQEIKSTWQNTKKVFRYIKRETYYIYGGLFKIDLSIVKSSKKQGYNMIPEYSIQDAGIFENEQTYEIEIELMNENAISQNVNDINKQLKQTITYILSGLQQTNFPISYVEQKQILKEYLKLVKGDEYSDDMRVYPKDFIGYSSLTLQMGNIYDNNNNTTIPNIRNNYTVTDKADGDRKLMYFSATGKVYLIDTNMNVQFTGVKGTIFTNTILDGEHTIHDKNGRFINLYSAFDIYFLDGKDERMKLLVQTNPDDIQANFRLPLLLVIIKNLNLEPIIADTSMPIRITNKNYEISSPDKSIFKCCYNILKKQKDGLFEYNTDGLIFTPSNMGVALNANGIPNKIKTTWEYSFKWKPPQYNTIDFFVTTKKTSNGSDLISNIFTSGMQTDNIQQISQYKTLILRVGFDERKHGYINPCQDICDGKNFNVFDKSNEDSYKPVPFYPTNPIDSNASICNIMMTPDATGNKNMISSEGEIIEDQTIVEFYYDKSKDEGWKWMPLRIRYDKTSEYRAGLKNYGNAYHVANSNWYSIHNPISEEMISTGENIPIEIEDDNVYYNRTTKSSKTTGLRDFHNLYVKSKLINSVSKKGNILIDYAAGKGGDIPKWIAAELSFIFGIDISRDNIENRLDGSCARYLNAKKKYKNMPDAIFLNGDTSINIKNTEALYSDKAKIITNAIFGVGAKDETTLGHGIYKMYGKGSNGFDVGSMQFAIHYMFENITKLTGFLRNISECTKIGGYFVATTYDGQSVFNLLKDKNNGEGISIYEDETKIWEITKLYNNDEFINDISSLGYAINVYQETINKTFKEYLVNFNYLIRIMENYGFIIITKNEANRIGMPNGSGLFRELFKAMESSNIDKLSNNEEYKNAFNMSANERLISFLNRYMIFKKVRNVDAESVSLSLNIPNIVNEPITFHKIIISNGKKIRRNFRLIE